MMKRLSLSAWVVVLSLVVLIVSGCKGSDDAPTNTKDSQYVGGGQTEADKIGAQRARAHPHTAGQP